MEIDFSEPRWLINYYHFIGALSVILNSLGNYLLAFHTEKLGNFRWFLLVFLVSCSMTDIQVTYLCQFVPLSPMIAGYSLGVQGTLLGLSAHVSLTITFPVTIIQMECLALCFVKKHQSIAIISKTHVLPKPIKFIIYLMWIVTPFNALAWFSTLVLPEDQKFDYIMKEAPNLLEDFMALPNFDIYIKTTSFFLFFAAIISCGIVLNVLFVLCAYEIFYLMAKLKLQISPGTYQKHREAVISIMVQFGTSIICFVPPFFLAILATVNAGEAQFLIEIITAWFASHSTINMMCLLYFFPPYRKFLFNILRRSKTTKPFISPVLVSVT